MSRKTDHKESKAGVKAIYFTSKTLADGSHPFMVRITKDRKRKYIATGLTLHPQFWNEQTHTFRKNVPLERRRAIEAALRKWEEKYSDAAGILADADEVHDARSVASKVSTERLSTRKFKLIAFFEELIDQLKRTGKIGNAKVYKDVQNNLTRFVGENNDVSFEAVTVRFCNEWENKMRSEGLTEITLSVKFRTLRAVLNKAIANGYAKPTVYPFARNTAETNKFQISKFDLTTTKRAISKTDIRKIEAYQPPLDTGKYASLRNTHEQLQLAKDLFLFSYYCGGINFVDIATLRWSNIGTDLDNKPRLTYTRQKTNGKFSLRLMPVALDILKRYRPDKPTSNNYVFPILNSIFHRTPDQIHNRCNKIMKQVNKGLKIIGAAEGITTHLTPMLPDILIRYSFKAFWCGYSYY